MLDWKKHCWGKLYIILKPPKQGNLKLIDRFDFFCYFKTIKPFFLAFIFSFSNNTVKRSEVFTSAKYISFTAIFLEEENNQIKSLHSFFKGSLMLFVIHWTVAVIEDLNNFSQLFQNPKFSVVSITGIFKPHIRSFKWEEILWKYFFCVCCQY